MGALNFGGHLIFGGHLKYNKVRDINYFKEHITKLIESLTSTPLLNNGEKCVLKNVFRNNGNHIKKNYLNKNVVIFLTHKNLWSTLYIKKTQTR